MHLHQLKQRVQAKYTFQPSFWLVFISEDKWQLLRRSNDIEQNFLIAVIQIFQFAILRKLEFFQNQQRKISKYNGLI